MIKWFFLRVLHLDQIFSKIDTNEDEMVAAITESYLSNNLNEKNIILKAENTYSQL